MINAISILIGGVCGLYTLVTTLGMILNGKGLGNSEFAVTALLLVVSMGAIAVFIVARLLSLALLTFLVRGTVALEWARPSECVSFDSWLMCSWNFAGRNGRQEGLRVFGLGIALQGDHDKSIINALAPAT